MGTLGAKLTRCTYQIVVNCADDRVSLDLATKASGLVCTSR